MSNQIGLYLRDYLTGEKISFNFDSKWCELVKDEQIEHKANFQLPYKTTEDAIINLIRYLGLFPVNQSEKMKSGEKKHTLLLAGKLVTGQLLLVKILIGFTSELGCCANVIAKCADEGFSEIVLKSIC